MDDLIYHGVDFGRTALRHITMIGNGKDADLTIAFVDGRRFQLGVNDMDIKATGSHQVRVSGAGDSSLKIEYATNGLRIDSAAFAFSNDHDEWQTQFEEELRKWAEAEESRPLLWCADVRIVLTSAHG